MQAGQFVVKAKREAVGRIPWRRTVELMRVERRGIESSVVFRGRTCVGSVEESAFHASTQIEGDPVVIADAVVLCVGDRTETRAETSWSRACGFADEVARKRVDVAAVGDLAAGVAVADKIRVVRAAVNDARDEIAADAAFQGRGKDVCRGRDDIWIDAANRETCADNTTRSIKARSGWTQG